ncbi:hypothetical protein JOF44_003947 [Brachybacterium fresconis]|uniref:Uncharacterized protein n=1 Tax=Brachybacterium fresconis TaxID=173363 RepID=A0ABS4YQK3_9MICO|nr:hypothetical protein [Brachybacterium fresconis]
MDDARDVRLLRYGEGVRNALVDPGPTQQE